jgi:hypothetical protein
VIQIRSFVGRLAPQSSQGVFFMHLRPTLRSAGGRLGAAVATGALIATVVAPAPSALAASPTTSATTVLTLSSTAIKGVPTSIAPGWHTFVLKESAKQAAKDPRGVTVEKFAKGYTRAMFKKDIAASFGEKPNLKLFARLTKNVQALGGLDLDRQFTATADRFTVYLSAGTYILDSGATEDGAPDVLVPVTVKGKAVGKKPATVGTLTSKEFAFKIVGAKKGKHEYALHDAGAQIHMYEFYRLDKGHTMAEIQAALQTDGPPPAWIHNGGFAGVISGGQTMYTTLNFSAKSDYLLICFMPDVKTGAPHFALGMVRLFAVK